MKSSKYPQAGDKHIFFWQNFPNHLQSTLIRSLAEHANLRVTLMVETDIPEWRRTLGWTPPDFGNARIFTNPDHDIIQSIFYDTEQESVHILSGLRAYKLPWQAFQYGIQTNARMALYSEPEKWLSIKGRIRLMRGKLDVLRYEKYIDFVLAIGHLGVEWFSKCAYSPQKIYPYGYFIEPSILPTAMQQMDVVPKTNFQIVFIGQCIHRKGIDFLLQALSGLCDFSWELTIIGDGDDRTKLQQLSQELGLSGSVHFTGALPNTHAMQYLSQADLLVLPSRWDGWGAVVNEALGRGVPVVCSTNCGAADLLQNDIRGAVFSTGSIEELRDKLHQQILLGKTTATHKNIIKNWAENNITGEVAANYLISIIDKKRNQALPPWLIS